MAKKRHTNRYKSGTGYGKLWQAPVDNAEYIDWNDPSLQTHYLESWTQQTENRLVEAALVLEEAEGLTKQARDNVKVLRAKLKEAEKSDTPVDVIAEFALALVGLNKAYAEADKSEKSARTAKEKISTEGIMKMLKQLQDFASTGYNKIGNLFKNIYNKIIHLVKVADVCIRNIGIKASDTVMRCIDDVKLSLTKVLALFRGMRADSAKNKQLANAQGLGSAVNPTLSIESIGLNHRQKIMESEISVLDARIDFAEKWNTDGGHEKTYLEEEKKKVKKELAKTIAHIDRNKSIQKGTVQRDDGPEATPEAQPVGTPHTVGTGTKAQIADGTKKIAEAAGIELGGRGLTASAS